MTLTRSQKNWWFVSLGLPWCLLALSYALATNEHLVRPHLADGGSGYAMLIMSLSLVFEFLVLRVGELRSMVLARALTLIEGAKVGMLVAYWAIWTGKLAKTPWGIVFGVCAAIIACLVVAACFAVTSAATRLYERSGEDRPAPNQTRRLAAIARQLHRSRIQAISCMLLAFLHMLYFLTFALAFHDKTSKQPTLQVSTNVYREPRFTTLLQRPIIPVHNSCVVTNRAKVWRIFFLEKNSDLEATKRLLKIVDTRKQEAYICNSELSGRIALLSQLDSAAKVPSLETRIAAWNIHEIYELRRLFSDLVREAPYRRYRATIVAHATPSKTAAQRRWNSNRDVSQSRIDSVEELLTLVASEVSPKGEALDLEFRARGVADQNTFLDPDPVRWADADELNRFLSAEISIEAVASGDEITRRSQDRAVLTLLDYLYFMIYTVSTTGYGDIAPVSNTAKFLVSVANIFELFFIVIIFNAVFALGGLSVRLRRVPTWRRVNPEINLSTDGGTEQN